MGGKALLLHRPILEQNRAPCQLSRLCLVVCFKGHILFIGKLRDRPQYQSHRSPPLHLSCSGLVKGPTRECQSLQVAQPPSSCCSSKVCPSVSASVHRILLLSILFCPCSVSGPAEGGSPASETHPRGVSTDSWAGLGSASHVELQASEMLPGGCILVFLPLTAWGCPFLGRFAATQVC